MTGTEYIQADASSTPENSALLPVVNRWGAIYTKSRCEKQVGEYLAEHRIPYYLPLMRRKNMGNREIRYFFIPLFSSYVFFDAGAMERKKVFESRKVADVLDVPDQDEFCKELENIILALSVDDTLCRARYDEVGKKVVVKKGKLKGMEGEVIRVEGKTRLLLKIRFLGLAASLAIDESMIEADI